MAKGRQGRTRTDEGGGAAVGRAGATTRSALGPAVLCAVVLLVVYVGSRIFLHNPPGEGNAGKVAPNAPLEQKLEEINLQIVQHEIHPLACVVLLWVTIALMSVTAEFVSVITSCVSASR